MADMAASLAASLAGLPADFSAIASTGFDCSTISSFGNSVSGWILSSSGCSKTSGAGIASWLAMSGIAPGMIRAERDGIGSAGSIFTGSDLIGADSAAVTVGADWGFSTAAAAGFAAGM